MKITVKPLTAQTWPDLQTVILGKGCSIARGCWCMYYRESGRSTCPPNMKQADYRKRQLRALVDEDPPIGLIGYAGGEPVGWVSFGPRKQFKKLARSPVMKPVDETPVWSIVCFVVPKPHRGKGVASALLKAVVDHARRRGATVLEAYPIDKPTRGADEWMWHGAKSMFDRAGFVEVARRRPARPIVRLGVRRAKPRPKPPA